MSLKDNPSYIWKRYPAEMEIPKELEEKYGDVGSYLEIIDV
jgi:hypothetical protein